MARSVRRLRRLLRPPWYHGEEELIRRQNTNASSKKGGTISTRDRNRQPFIQSAHVHQNREETKGEKRKGSSSIGAFKRTSKEAP